MCAESTKIVCSRTGEPDTPTCSGSPHQPCHYRATNPGQPRSTQTLWDTPSPQVNPNPPAPTSDSQAEYAGSIPVIGSTLSRSNRSRFRLDLVARTPPVPRRLRPASSPVNATRHRTTVRYAGVATCAIQGRAKASMSDIQRCASPDFPETSEPGLILQAWRKEV